MLTIESIVVESQPSILIFANLNIVSLFTNSSFFSFLDMLNFCLVLMYYINLNEYMFFCQKNS